MSSQLVPSAVRLLSRVRGERIIHAKGRCFTGFLDVSGGQTGVPLLDEAARHEVLIRLSRSVGLPDALPDALGLAVRVLDAHGAGRHQDLLMTTGSRRPVLRHLITLRRDLTGAAYTSLAPYRFAGRSLLLGALPAAPAPSASSLSDLSPEQVVFDLVVGGTRGSWTTWGRLTGTGVAAEGRAVRFAPETTGGGIEAPWLMTRQGAYPASHVAPDEVRS